MRKAGKAKTKRAKKNKQEKNSPILDSVEDQIEEFEEGPYQKETSKANERDCKRSMINVGNGEISKKGKRNGRNEKARVEFIEEEQIVEMEVEATVEDSEFASEVEPSDDEEDPEVTFNSSHRSDNNNAMPINEDVDEEICDEDLDSSKEIGQ